MATITAADLTLLREQQQYTRLYLSVLQPDTLLAARVNNGAIARGARTIAYDTGTGAGFASIEAGQTLWVGEAAGTYNVGTVRIKSIAGAQAAGTITIDENGIDWVDDLYLTVKREYRIWPVPPRIDRATGSFYKFYNTAYVDQNEEPNSVALMGSHRAGFLDPVAGTLVFTLNGSDSYVTASGASISSYAWTTTGGAIANAAIAITTITFNAAGTYWVTLTVTDDNGKTQATRRVFFVYDTNTLPYRNFNISNLSGDWNSAGWSFNVEVFGDVALSDFPDGTLCLLWYQNYFAGAEDYVNLWDISNEIVCAGYIQRETDDDDLAESGTGNVSFTVVSPAGVLANKSISPGTVSLETATNPATWWEYETWLTAGRAVHHLLKWHSTVMETCDVIGLLDNTIQVYQVSFVEESLLDMANNFAYERGIFAKLASDRLGRLHFVEDIQYFDESDRGDYDTIFSIIAQDLSGTIQLARAPVKETALAFLDGIDFDGTPPGAAYVAGIPGYTDVNGVQIGEFDGRGSLNKTKQILANSADATMKVGRLLAAANNPLREMRLDLRANYLGAFDIIPSNGWYSWGIADGDLKRALSLNSTLWLCRRVEIRQNLSGELFSGELTTGVVLEGEAFGPDGVILDYPTGYPTPSLPTPNWTPISVSGVYAYFAGGKLGGAYLATADRLILATGSSAANAVSNLSSNRKFPGGVSDAVTYGYFAGGETGFGAYSAVTDRITFATGVTAANAVSNLSAARRRSGGVSDGATYGYFAGGVDGSGVSAVTDRITFATGVTAANAVSNLSLAREGVGPVSDGTTYGYFGGGNNPLYGISGELVTTDSVTFATSVTALLGGFLSVARWGAVGTNGSTYGYFMGTEDAGGGIATTDEITFSTRAIAARPQADLTTGYIEMAGASSSLYGYAAHGGFTTTYVFDQLVFSTRINAATIYSLSDLRLGFAGVSDGHV